MARTGLTVGSLLAALVLVPAGCALGPQRMITAQASYGHDIPVALPVEPVGLDAPDGPILNSVGGEVPLGVYTAPVETSGLDDPEPAPATVGPVETRPGGSG